MAHEMRVTFFFESIVAVRAVGWTETWWYNQPSEDYLTVNQFANDLAVKRARLLGTGYQLTQYRVSQEGVFRDSALSFTGPYTSGTVGSKLAPGEGDFAYSVLNVRCESGPKNRKAMYLSGVPDELQVIDGLPTDARFKAAFQAWRNELKSHWAWFGLTKDPVTNKAPKKVLNPNPPPKYTPRPMQLYPITDAFIRTYTSHRRGRPFDLLVGRRKQPSA